MQREDLPNTWIICIPLYDEVAGARIGTWRHDLDVSSLRITRASDNYGLLIDFAKSCTENLHVVAVQMDLRVC